MKPLLWLLVVLICSPVLHADKIILDGDIEIEGEILSTSGNEIKIKTNDGVVSLPKSEVKKTIKSDKQKEQPKQISVIHETSQKTYRNELYSISYPANWEVREMRDKVDAVIIKSPGDENNKIRLIIVYTIEKDRKDNRFLNIDKMYDLATSKNDKNATKWFNEGNKIWEKMLNGMENQKVIKSSFNKVGEYVWFTYDLLQKDKLAKEWLTPLQNNTGMVEIVYACKNKEILLKNMALIEEAIKTFKIIKF